MTLDLDIKEGPRLSSNLNQTQKTEVRELISQYQGVFSSMPGLTRRVETN